MLLSEFLTQYPDVDREAGLDLSKVAALAQELDRTGSVTLELKATKANSRVMVTVGWKTKEPRSDAEAGLWHVGPKGLTKESQYQGRIDPVTGEIHTARED